MQRTHKGHGAAWRNGTAQKLLSGAANGERTKSMMPDGWQNGTAGKLLSGVANGERTKVTVPAEIAERRHAGQGGSRVKQDVPLSVHQVPPSPARRLPLPPLHRWVGGNV